MSLIPAVPAREGRRAKSAYFGALVRGCELGTANALACRKSEGRIGREVTHLWRSAVVTGAT